MNRNLALRVFCRYRMAHEPDLPTLPLHYLLTFVGRLVPVFSQKT
ncbi:MAG: hypothetical protein AAF393_19025 [Pseudomonadota bacterium]